jgi:hypothetical protein
VKSEHLATDTAFLARSLGFAVSRTARVIKGTTYHRLTLSGHTDQIPCRLARKKAAPRQQKKDPLVSGFAVEPIGVGAYYGFELDGDHLYLLKDFTVTHNTVVSMMTIAHMKLPTLIVVTKEDLLKQWQEAVEKFLGLTRKDYGIIQGDTCDVEGKKLAIAMIHSIAKEGRYPSWAYDQWGLVIFDECITGEAMIDLYPTRQIRMDELATRVQGGETFEVWSYDKALDTFVVQTVSHSWTKGTRPILEVELEDGRTLRCTPEHLLMTTNRGWVRAGDLTTEDDVMELDL